MYCDIYHDVQKFENACGIFWGVGSRRRPSRAQKPGASGQSQSQSQSQIQIQIQIQSQSQSQSQILNAALVLISIVWP